MSFTKCKVWTILVLSLAVGCPLEDLDVGADSGTTNGNTGGDQGGQTSGGSSGATEGELDAGTGGEPNATNGSPDASSGPSSDDAGATGGAEMDANTGSTADANTGSANIDAGAPDADADPDAEVLADAGEVDAGHDSGPEIVDAGPPIEVPDLGDATMSDADRAALIISLVQNAGHLENWAPYLQPTGARRPLMFTGPSTHGIEVTGRQNPVAKQATDAWLADGMPLPLDLPNGSIITKDSYKRLDPMDPMSEMVHNGTLIMAKVDVLDDPIKYKGDWFFARISPPPVPPAAPVAYAYPSACINCHNGTSQKILWPPNPMVMGDLGGKPEALAPYDYLFLAFCTDPKTTECKGPLSPPPPPPPPPG